MKKDALWHLLFLLFFNFIFLFGNATIEEMERTEAVKMGEIQEIGNAIRKINLLQFNLAIRCQIHWEYKLAGEKLKQMLLDDHSSDHSRLIHFPLPWLMGLNLAIGADQGLERQRILMNALDILVEESGRLLAMDDLRRYVGLQGHLRRLTPAYLMHHYEANAPGNNLLILRLEFWTSFAKTALQNGPDEFLHVFSPSLLTTLTNKLAQLKNAQIIIPEIGIGTMKLEEFGRNELKKWTKIGMDELREAKRGEMNLKEIWRRKRRLKAIRQAKIHFETMYLRVEMLLELFSLAMALCTRLSEQQAQQQKDPVLGFKEIVERFYKRAKRSYKMAEQGRELANLVAVNLLPNEAKEMGETSRKKAEKGKIVNEMEENRKRVEKDGNEGEELDEEIANLINLNLEKNIEEEEEENWPKNLTKTNEKGKEKVDEMNSDKIGGKLQREKKKARKPSKIIKDYHKVLKVMEGNLIRKINLPKAIAENEAEIVESNLERRMKLLEKETIGEIGELIGIVNFVEDRKYGHWKMDEKILKEVQAKSSSLN